MTSYRLPIEAGGPEGTNSAYVVPDRGLLVDPGPPGDDAWAELRDRLAQTGVDITAIDHIVGTHWHSDHVGLIPRLATAADAKVHMHERDAPYVAAYSAERERRLQRDTAALRSWGVPPDRVTAVIDADAPSPLPDTTPVESHSDGETIAGATVLHTPGHTEGHIALSVGDDLFVGDTLLPMYTSNVGGSDTRAENPLAAMVNSLDRLESHGGTLHPGHGTEIEIPERIESVRTHYRTRTQQICDRVAELSAPTPWDIAVDLFGEMRGVHVKFGAGEAAAHLSSLVASGAVVAVSEDPLRFALQRSPETDADTHTHSLNDG